MSRRENSGKKAEKIEVMIKWVHDHTLNRNEQIQGLHAKGERNLTEAIQTWRQRHTDVYPYRPCMTASSGHSDHSCGSCPEQYGAHRRYAISTD